MTMAGEMGASDAAHSSETKASVLITISTPETTTPICRLGSSEDVIEGMTVQELIERVISPNSLLSVGVPLSQLETESPTALSVGEMLSAECCEVFLAGNGQASIDPISLDVPVRSIASEQVGAQGNRFLNITLDVRSAPDAVSTSGDDRRRVAMPASVEAEQDAAPSSAGEHDGPQGSAASEGDIASLLSAENGDAAAAPDSMAETDIMTIVAEAPAEQPKTTERWDRKEYVRKADWLRAQFLPEVNALDFSGLFVGNLGLGVRETKTRRNVVLADPSRITDVLLRANGYRRSGDHAKALICYQELVDMDPGNADFRLLLGKTMVELGQQEDAVAALTRAKELGHDGAEKELGKLRREGNRQRRPLGFLRFWRE
jgi:hypothetical protein